MWKVTWKGIVAHKVRLMLTGIAIVLGVTFVSGTYILTDTLHATFTNLVGTAFSSINLEVRGVSQFSGTKTTRNPISQSILDEVRRVPGVEAADGEIYGYAQFIARTGKPISNKGGGNVGFSFDANTKISIFQLRQGSAPSAPDQVVMDVGTASKHGFKVGDKVKVLLPGAERTFVISGLAGFGAANNLAGTTLAGFTMATAQAVEHEVGEFTAINIAVSPGVNQATVQATIARMLPKGVEVVTGQTIINEQTQQIDNALGFFSTALLVFAFIALFVGAFTILNTFSIIVGQRTREMALLRAVGARRGQVFRTVILEAALVGLIASGLGIGLGFLTALGLEALLSGFGVSLPSGTLVFELRTVVVSLIVGVGVTVIAAISPARRAVRIPPVAAFSDLQAGEDGSVHRRSIWGGAVTALGILGLGVGLTAPKIQLVGLGAVGLFVGVTMLAPAIARPVVGILGVPFARVFRQAGMLGRQNSMRSPRRTAQTASALMVGLALVSAIAVFGASLDRSVTTIVDQAVAADLIVTATSNAGSGKLSNAVASAASSVPGVRAETLVYSDQFTVKGKVNHLGAISTPHLATNVLLRMTAGTADSLSSGDLMVDSTTARSDHLSVGEILTVKFALTGADTLRIGGIFRPNTLIGHYLVGAPVFLAHFTKPLANAVLLNTGGSGAVDGAVTKALSRFPTVQVQTRAQFEKTQSNGVANLLHLVYALLALAVLIALIGIVNTLMLSVFERTREIGLLRAVGMKRRQVRMMIRSEAVILSIFGALIGIVVGTGLGVALVESLRNNGITQLVIPGRSLVAFVVLAAVLGLGAAAFPARRAARLDVLGAIATE